MCESELLRFVSGRTQAAAFAHLVLCFIYATTVSVGVMELANCAIVNRQSSCIYAKEL